MGASTSRRTKPPPTKTSWPPSTALPTQTLTAAWPTCCPSQARSLRCRSRQAPLHTSEATHTGSWKSRATTSTPGARCRPASRPASAPIPSSSTHPASCAWPARSPTRTTTRRAVATSKSKSRCAQSSHPTEILCRSIGSCVPSRPHSAAHQPRRQPAQPPLRSTWASKPWTEPWQRRPFCKATTGTRTSSAWSPHTSAKVSPTQRSTPSPIASPWQAIPPRTHAERCSRRSMEQEPRAGPRSPRSRHSKRCRRSCLSSTQRRRQPSHRRRSSGPPTHSPSSHKATWSKAGSALGRCRSCTVHPTSANPSSCWIWHTMWQPAWNGRAARSTAARSCTWQQKAATLSRTGSSPSHKSTTNQTCRWPSEPARWISSTQKPTCPSWAHCVSRSNSSTASWP